MARYSAAFSAVCAGTATLNIHEKEVRRILDPHHATKLSTMERTLAALGQRIELQITAK
jgi:hypothetical protein